MFQGLFQPTHLIVIFAVYFLFFGGKKLPELGKGLGEGIRGLKDALREAQQAATETPSNPNESPASKPLDKAV